MSEDLGPKAERLAQKYGYLPYMVERYLSFLGAEETLKMLEANEKPLPSTLRVNSLKIETDVLRKRLEKKGFKLEPLLWLDYGFRILNEPLNLGSLHEFLQGHYYLQNVASMLPPIILNPRPGETLVDMCASPGGKSTHLAQIMENQGRLILIEKNRKRLRALDLNLRRMGVQNSVLYHMDAIQLSKLKLKADKILLDAPCTGEGLIREDPSRKISRTPQDLERLSQVQKQLLTAGLAELKIGGKLLYCTCSIAPEENELVIQKVLKNKPQYQISPIDKAYGVPGLTKVYGKSLIPELKQSRRIYPHKHDTIGFFMCLVEKIK